MVYAPVTDSGPLGLHDVAVRCGITVDTIRWRMRHNPEAAALVRKIGRILVIDGRNADKFVELIKLPGELVK